MAKNYAVSPQNDEAEYKVVRRDLIFVIVMNLCFLVILLGLYFINRNGSVDAFFARLLKF
jgi:hypothetical protein